jgi:heat shock protein HslJ
MRRTKSPLVAMAVSGLLILSMGSAALAASGKGGTLEGPIWVLQTYAVGQTVLDVPSGVDANAIFSAGTVHGKSGCNTFSGSYTASGSSLTFGPLATTMKMCGVPEDPIETAYLAALGAASTYRATASDLVIYDANGSQILRYAAESPAGVDHHAWHLLAYNNGKQAVVSVIDGTDPTAYFGSDGIIGGNGTCNQFSGPYTAANGVGKIGPLMSTLMACPNAEQQDQETAYLAALQNATMYRIQGSDLQLRDGTGVLQAEFTAVVSEPMPMPAGNLGTTVP